MSNESIKKIAALGIIGILFIILVVAAFFIKNPTEDIPIDIPIGGHGQSGERPEESPVYIQINENETNLDHESLELKYIIRDSNLTLSALGKYYAYDGYYVFPDRNIKIKKSYNRILNLVFLNDYKSSIVNGIDVKTKKNDIINKLGSPNYNEGNLLIYKTNEYYIIFNEALGEVSVYFRNNDNLEAFWNLYNMYLNDKDLKGYVSALTKEYPAYTRYIYDSDGLELLYSDLGIRLYFKEFNKENGVYLYSNYQSDKDEYSKDNLKKLEDVHIKNLNLIGREEIDRTSYEEKKKNFSLPAKIYSDNKIYNYINTSDSYLNIQKEVVESSDRKLEKEYKNIKEFPKYSIYFESNNPRYSFNNVSIISKNSNRHYNLDSAKVADYLLLTEDYVYFSIKYDGISRININTGKIESIIHDMDKYELKYIKNKYLFFDDVRIKIF